MWCERGAHFRTHKRKRSVPDTKSAHQVGGLGLINAHLNYEFVCGLINAYLCFEFVCRSRRFRIVPGGLGLINVHLYYEVVCVCECMFV
jgi:hypothetical protein